MGKGEGRKKRASLGVSGKALVTAYLLFRSGKIKICIQVNLVLQEQLPSIVMNPE
ncbi:MAG: hypothetical protein NC094_13915 [Bacteroidales bacterium]|nr:hypothetical protein [Bacteroidales bacterium]